MTATVFRPGLEGVVVAETAISTLDEGLQYRGYAVEDLARNATFEETAYLLLYGEAPTQDELSAFRQRLAANAAVNDRIVDVLRTIPPQTAMIDAIRTGASLLAHWDPDAGDDSQAANLRKAERLLAQLPVVLAIRHRLSLGQAPIAPDGALPLAANLLWMLRGEPPGELHVRAMDASLIMYAELELNASAFTVRVVGSTLSDLHSSVVAAIGALKGPLHGGANARVMDVFQEVNSAESAEAWVRNALAQKRRIMGFGHRVYRSGDPRAEHLKLLCAQLAPATGHETLEQTAGVIERAVFETKNLRPNVDWPTARLYYYLGLPRDIYTPLFAVSRVAGWTAHFLEQRESNRLISPRASYRGPAPRRWTPLR